MAEHQVRQWYEAKWAAGRAVATTGYLIAHAGAAC